MRQLLVGRLGGRGLAAVFDPDGPDPERFPGLEKPTGLQVVVAGEIFNLTEIAGELGLPETFSPEAVLAAAFERSWRDVLPRLRGSFALVAVDERNSRGLVAVDQGGGHSAYFRRESRRLVLASEIHLLLELLPSRPAPDPVGVVHWFSDDAAPVGRTLYAGVEALPAGACLEIGASGWKQEQYWQPRFAEPDQGLSADDAADLLWTTLVSSVRQRLGAGERIGIVMSSGVDSTAVGAAAVAAGEGQRLHGYSVVFPGYPDERVDETDRVEALTGALGVDRTWARLEPGGAFALSLEWLRAWAVPMGGPGYLLEHVLLKLAAEAGITAVLDGQGGDEGFAVSPFWLADLLRAGRVAESVRMARQFPGGSESWRDTWDVWQEHALLGAVPAWAHDAWRRHVRPERLAPPFLNPEKARLHVETDDVWAWKHWEGVPAWWAERTFLLTADRQAVGVGDYTRRRAAMAGVKARPPLLDPDLVECLLTIPPRLGFDPVFDRVLIRRALAGRVPDSVRLWTRKSHLGPFFFDIVAGPDLPGIREILDRPRLEVGEFVKPGAVRDLLENVPAATDPERPRWMIDVWRLATAECWLRSQEDSSLVETLLQSPLPRPRWAIHEGRGRAS